jgi:histidine ammonia-lyase
LSSARLGMLFRPDLTGLAPFLAHGAAGSSGLMIGEYVVQDVLATLRTAVVPVSGGTVSISLGLEDHAGFATQGARLLRYAAAEAPVIVAVEALAAVRALRLMPDRLIDGPAREAFEHLAQGIDPAMEDRPMGEDIARVVDLLPGLGRFLGEDL